MARICGICGHHMTILDRANFDNISPNFIICDSCWYKTEDLVSASKERNHTACMNAIKKLNALTNGNPPSELVSIYKKYFPTYTPGTTEAQKQAGEKPKTNNSVIAKSNHADSIRTLAQILLILGFIWGMGYGLFILPQNGLYLLIIIIIVISLGISVVALYLLLIGFADIIENTAILAEKADMIAEYTASIAENIQVLNQLNHPKKQVKSDDDAGTESADKN